MFYICTFPVLFCSTYLSTRFWHFTSCPCVFPASLITCPALISFTCPSLSTHLVCLVCVLPAVCVSSSLCQTFSSLFVSVIDGFLGFELPLPDFTFWICLLGLTAHLCTEPCLLQVKTVFFYSRSILSESCCWVLLLVLPVVTLMLLAMWSVSLHWSANTDLMSWNQTLNPTFYNIRSRCDWNSSADQEEETCHWAQISFIPNPPFTQISLLQHTHSHTNTPNKKVL